MQSDRIDNRKGKAKPKKKTNWLLAVLILGFTLYVMYLIVDQHIQINNAKAELARLDEKIYAQEQVNAELKTVADAVVDKNESAYSGYVEKVAREELDYVKNGEVVFINTAGD